MICLSISLLIFRELPVITITGIDRYFSDHYHDRNQTHLVNLSKMLRQRKKNKKRDMIANLYKKLAMDICHQFFFFFFVHHIIIQFFLIMAYF